MQVDGHINLYLLLVVGAMIVIANMLKMRYHTGNTRDAVNRSDDLRKNDTHYMVQEEKEHDREGKDVGWEAL